MRFLFFDHIFISNTKLYKKIYKFITFPILSGDVSLGGNFPQFLKSPSYPLYLSRSLSHEAQLHGSYFLTNNESYSFYPSPSKIIKI